MRTRRLVLEAAVRCFEARGFDETNTAMIASEAGVAVGTVYAYFKDKRDILLEAIDDMTAEISAFVIRELDPVTLNDREPEEVVRSLIDALFHSQRLQPGIQRILWERYFKDPKFQQPFDDIRSRIRVAIDLFVSALDTRGLLRSIDRASASFVILNAVQWNATQSVLHEGTPDTEAAAAEMADMIVRYLFQDLGA
ncbi:MAG: TetR/AcrR family transcriptional regulator [Pseudomonadota bacterium]